MNTCPHELAPLLLALGRAEIELALHPTDPARLRHRPADLPPDLSARLRIHRAAVLGLLVVGYAPAGDTDTGYAFAERLGVADGLGLATHPGSAAWLVAVGEALAGADGPLLAPADASNAERLAGIVAAAWGVPVNATVIGPHERFPGEPTWGDPLARPKPRPPPD